MTISIGGQSILQRGGPFNPATQFQFVRGFNQDVDTASVPQTVWPDPAGGVAALGDPAAAISVVSTDAADTAAGTGMRSIALFGVDSSFNGVLEVVTMNGTTPVLTIATDFIFVNIATTATAGSGKTNAGTISMTIGGTLVNVIPIGQGVTQTAAQVLINSEQPNTLPNLIDILISVGRVNAALATISLTFETSITVASQEISVASDGGPFALAVKGPLPFNPGTFVRADVIAVSANNTAVNANIQFAWL